MSIKRAVVFSGGGAKGSYQIGAWKALNELDFKPSIVTGTSVGALNGALLALDKYDEAIDIWQNMGMSHVFSQFVSNSSEDNPTKEANMLTLAKEILTKGGADYLPLQNLVRNMMDEDKLRASAIEFGLVTTVLPGIKPVQLFIEDIPKGEAADYIIASAAAFPIMKSYKIGETKYVDGGYSDNMPIKMALSRGAEEIVAVNVGKTNAAKLKSTNAVIHYIHAKRPYNDGKFGSIIYFDRDLSSQNIRQGYLDTLKNFGRYDGYYYTFEKFERYKVTAYEKLCAMKFESIFSGLPNVTKFEKHGRENVLSLLRQYEDRPFEFNSNVLYCAEITAEVFSINPQEVYTMKSISKLILDESLKLINDKEKEATLSALVATLDNGIRLELFKSLVDVKDKLLLTSYAIQLMKKERITAIEKKRLWLIACLSAESFCAALFSYAVQTAVK